MSGKKTYIIGNWKLYVGVTEGQRMAERIAEGASLKGQEVVVCPSFPLLALVRDAFARAGIQLGAQDVFWEAKGAYTGEVSAEQLAEAGCRYAIVGHSERREYFGETDEMVARKIQACFRAGIVPIVCIGETSEERAEGKEEEVITRQAAAVPEFEEGNRVVVAYEPRWAIGTGEACSPQLAQQAAGIIHESLQKKGWDNAAILYGGSVTAENAASFCGMPSIHGVLVGGASASAEEFLAIIRSCKE